MIKSKKQMLIVILVAAFIMIIGNVTYAYFTYSKEGADNSFVMGDIHFNYIQGNGEITLTNVFPETKEEARERNDNFITFNISGKNTSNKTAYYDFVLSYGTSQNSPKSRYKDNELRLDLVELDSNGNEVSYLLSDATFDHLVNQRIYADSIDANTSSEVTRYYKLRMWLSEDVIISDSEPNANYSTTEYPNKYASIKLTATSDFTEKSFGYQKVQKAIATKTDCVAKWEENGITYPSGTTSCINYNYVWYSGKLWRITSIYPDGSMKMITENAITIIAYNSSSNKFYTDENNKSLVYQWLNEEFYDTLYNPKEFIDTSKKWNTTKSTATNVYTPLEKTDLVTAPVGLLDSDEYYNSYRCSNSTCTSHYEEIGYLNIYYNWYLLNPYDDDFSWRANSAGTSSRSYTYDPLGIRPVIVLKNTVEFTGDGTINSPYKVVGDKLVGKTNEFINTRQSGEYVKLKNGSNEQLFRIIGVNDSKTKIIAMDYADNKATRVFSNNVADTIWGNGTTTDADTWYTYLNDTYFANLLQTYGQIFDSGIFYYGASGSNYKLSICANTTSGNTKVCTKTSDSSTLNIGLPRYGEMMAAQQSGGKDYSIQMWLMNRFQSNRVTYITGTGMSDRVSATTAYGARPVVYLKSTVKIKSGTGTKNDPYVVGL